MSEANTPDLIGALDAIDAANADDPNHVEGQPRAQFEGQLATQWVAQLAGNPNDALVLAARAHHLRRWVVPRADYPEGRAGYLKWRKDQKVRHGQEVAEILAQHGYADDVISRAADLLERKGLGTDVDTQVLEDAACLVFLETQYQATLDRLDHDQMVNVVAKTLKKMSPRAIDMAGTLPLSESGQALLNEAAVAVRSAH